MLLPSVGRKLLLNHREALFETEFSISKLPIFADVLETFQIFHFLPFLRQRNPTISKNYRRATDILAGILLVNITTYIDYIIFIYIFI